MYCAYIVVVGSLGDAGSHQHSCSAAELQSSEADILARVESWCRVGIDKCPVLS